jgi:hypothetical protein
MEQVGLDMKLETCSLEVLASNLRQATVCRDRL